MKRLLQFAVVSIIAAEALVLGQGSEAARVLGEMRAALGGEKLAAIKSFIATGQSARSLGQFQLSGDFEVSCELPDKYVKKETLSMGNMGSTSSTVGFNGEALIQEAGQPGTVAMGGGTMMFRASPGGGGGAVPGGAQPTPEQQAAMKALSLRTAKADFTRLTVALFGASYAGNPVEFSHLGQAEAPDGKADVILIKGANEFAAKLFVDGRTHVPLMMSWEAPGTQLMTSGMRMGAPGGGAPMVMSGGGGGAMVAGGGGGGMVSSGGQGAQGGRQLTPEEREKMQKENEDRMKALQAAAQKPVEHRLYFSEYRVVDGVKLPFKIIRSIDGQTTEEIAFDKFRLNAKIDEKKFKAGS